MTNEERIAVFIYEQQKRGISPPWKDLSQTAKAYWIEKARYLLTFLRDELGFVQKDKDQVIPPIYEENFAQGMTLPTQREQELLRQGAEWLKHGAGFVRVKSILAEGK
jgi:hypothetical protein